MAQVKVRYYTDPACAWSWSTEPTLRRLMVEFGDSLSWTYVMGGLARDYTNGGEAVYPGLMRHWMDVSDEGGMPVDPRLWAEGPIASTYPACMAVKAASEQAEDGGYGYLRAVREGLFCFRRKLDTTEALVEEARRARLDVERFRVDLGSHAIVEAFGNDLEEVRNPPEGLDAELVETAGGQRRAPLPTMVFTGENGVHHFVPGPGPYASYRQAAEAAGAVAADAPRLDVLEALRRFGRMATVEVEAVCGLSGPRAPVELWRLASEWQVRPVRVLTGYLWEVA